MKYRVVAKLTKLAFVGIFTVSILTACESKGFTYESQRDTPSGPGLFTGAKGEFVVNKVEEHIFAENKKREADKAEDLNSEEGDLNSEEDRKQFEEFQAFKKWKASQQDDPEVQEFIEWMKWKELKKQN